MAKYKNISDTVLPGVDIFKALGDESRLRAFLALHESELCVCQLVELLQLAPSTVSKHLSILRQAGLIDSRKDARWVYYRQVDLRSLPYRKHLEAIMASLIDSPAGRDLTRQLHGILKLDPETICQNYRSAG